MNVAAVKPCRCPICNWVGWTWSAVESRPGVHVRKACPQCASYPRDRMVWQLLHEQMRERDGKRLKVVEVGESGRAYLWKRRLYDYWNADIAPHDLGHVDLHVDELGVAVEERANAPHRPWGSVDRLDTPVGADVAILSYVLSAISSDRRRLQLLRQLHGVTSDTAALILFDDLQVDAPRHRKLRAGSYFHTVRLGGGLLSLMRQAAWLPTVIGSYPDTQLLASADLPFIVARKG